LTRRAFISFRLANHESGRLMEKLAEEAGGDYLTGYLGGQDEGHITVDFDAVDDDEQVLGQVEATLTAARRAVSGSDWARNNQPLTWPTIVVSAFELVPVARNGSSSRTIEGAEM